MLVLLLCYHPNSNLHIAYIIDKQKYAGLEAENKFPFQEAVAIGRTFAAMKDYQIDGNKEMIALGTMNVLGSFTSCYIATGKLRNFRYVEL